MAIQTRAGHKTVRRQVYSDTGRRRRFANCCGWRRFCETKIGVIRD